MTNPNEIRDTAEALLEDRGHFNARAWAEHCATRDPSGFWRKVRDQLDRLEISAGEIIRHELPIGR